MSGNQAQAGINAGSGSGSGGSGGSGGAGSNGASSKHITQQQQIMTSTATIVMSGSSASANPINNMAADSSPRESGDDSEDESEILEESPCGRWLKRREEVDQHDIPGISCVHLAMDTEEGVEVVWNEVPYGSIQELKSHEEKIRHLFENLLQLDHQNIVKFHRYWADTRFSDRPRLIFITEYMSSGSLKQFLKRTKRNAKRLPLEAWRRWCTQILSALSYLHSCTPPLIHGNIICDSIFIQHNGLVKIGTVVPDGFYSYYHRQQNEVEHVPECVRAGRLSAADDVYAFGMCALEMAALEIQTTTDAFNIDDATILRTINNLENDLQRDLIYKCLRRNSTERPNASELLFHPLLFEVHSLKLQAAHNLLFSPMNRSTYSDTVIDAVMQLYNRPDVVMAYVYWKCTVEEEVAEENPQSTEAETSTPEEQADQQQQKRKVEKLVAREFRLSDVPSADKLEKFVEDVKFGVYPLTAFGGKKPPQFRSRITSPEYGNSGNCGSPEPEDIENRRIVNMMCSVKKQKESSRGVLMNILLRMDDKMNRQLSCEVYENDTALDLTLELVRLGFVHTEDREKLEALLEETLRSTFAEGGTAFGETGVQERTFSAPVNDSNPMNKATVNNNTSSNNNNNNAKMITKTLPANHNMTSLNQMDAAAATASLMLKAQNQKQPQMSSSAASSPMPRTASTTTSLGIGGTVTVPMVDPLAGHVMYVPHEQIQQQQQQQSSNTSPHLTNVSAPSPTAISTNSTSSTSSTTTIN